MGEWLKPTDLKSVKAARSSGVRIPLPPPDAIGALCHDIIFRKEGIALESSSVEKILK